MKKLPPWTHRFVMPLILTGFMTVIVSGISTVRVAGLSGLSEHWLHAWAYSWMIAYPALLLVLPLVNRIMRAIVDVPKQ